MWWKETWPFSSIFFICILYYDVSFLSLPRDVVTAVYAIGAQTPEGWDFLFEKYQTSPTGEMHLIEYALTLTQDKDKLQW